MKIRMAGMAIAIVLLGSTLPAQTAPGIQQRKENQQQRIGEGVENGSLTAGEAARLERQETNLNRQQRRMSADGNLTAQERQRLRHEQNSLSREIYRDKHNARVQPPVTGTITARDRRQQQRIGEGIENGSLTAREASRLERQEANLNRREAKMTASGGGLTRGERNAINHQQNTMSRRIYRQKHDAQHR